MELGRGAVSAEGDGGAADCILGVLTARGLHFFLRKGRAGSFRI